MTTITAAYTKFLTVPAAAATDTSNRDDDPTGWPKRWA